MEVVQNISASEWADFMDSYETGNFLQSPEWGRAHELVGDTIVRSGVRVDGVLVAAWLGIIKNARRGRYLELPGGPMMNWGDDKLVRMVLSEIRHTARQHNCVFVRIRPQEISNLNMLQKLQQNGLRKAPMHLHAEHTNILDIRPSEEDVLAGMRRQTRYEVRRVEKRGVKISSSQPTPEEIDEFYNIQAETALRHGFVQSPRKFLQSLGQSFGDNIRLYRAEKDGKLLNLALVISWGAEVDYFEAASTPDARQEPGAYGVVWQVIRDAKELGYSRLNFWGIAYSSSSKHRYAGVTTFKRGFGGEDVEYVPAHDMVLKRWRYLINWTVETSRRKKRGL